MPPAPHAIVAELASPLLAAPVPTALNMPVLPAATAAVAPLAAAAPAAPPPLAAEPAVAFAPALLAAAAEGFALAALTVAVAPDEPVVAGAAFPSVVMLAAAVPAVDVPAEDAAQPD